MSVTVDVQPKITELTPNYFQTYLEKLPENTNKKFSYDPYVAKLPQFLSFTTLFCTIFSGGLFLISYPVAYIRDFWEARQVKLTSTPVHQNAIAALKKEVEQETLPIRDLAVELITARRAAEKQEALAKEEAEEGNADLARAIRESSSDDFITLQDLQTTRETSDLAEGIDYLAKSISQEPSSTLFLEMANQRLPEQLRKEALNHVNTLYGTDYTLGDQTIEDSIEVDDQIIMINRTINLEQNGTVVGSVNILAKFDCVNQTGTKHIYAELRGTEV